MNAQTEVLRQDTRGRVRVSAQRREALLDEFERSGASAAKFARLAGIKYPTFADWRQKRRQQRVAASSVAAKEPAAADEAAAKAAPVRLFEALLEGGGACAQRVAEVDGLLIELPGGCRMRIESPLHLELAAELVALIAQRAGGRC